MILKIYLQIQREKKRLKKNEVEVYLANSSKDVCNYKFDILSWWKNNCTKYLILSLITNEVLAILISTVASEFGFSIGERILDTFQSLLTLQIVQVLIYLQN